MDEISSFSSHIKGENTARPYRRAHGKLSGVVTTYGYVHVERVRENGC